MNRPLITTIGFAFLIIGFVSLILSIVGVRLTFLRFLDQLGSGISFGAKILFIVIGFILIYISKSTPESDSLS